MIQFGRLAVLGGMAVAITACGKKGALVYPDMLIPAAPTAVSAIQSGSGVKIQFDIPTFDRAGNRLNNLAGLKISKRESDSALEKTCRTCTHDYHLFRNLYLDLLPEGVERFGNRLVVIDGNVSFGTLYTYIAVPFTKDGMDGASSPQVSVKLVQAMLPPLLKAESYPTEIKIFFVSLPSVDGVHVGYNLYRAYQNSTFSYLPLNKEPLNLKEYVDGGLARGTTYRYVSRAVVRLPSGSIVESLVSNEVSGMLKDDE